MVDIPKNASEILRVEPHSFKGFQLFSLRVFVKSKEDGSWLPTKKGITCRLELLEPVIEALSAILARQASGELGDVFKEEMKLSENTLAYVKEKSKALQDRSFIVHEPLSPEKPKTKPKAKAKKKAKRERTKVSFDRFPKKEQEVREARWNPETGEIVKKKK